MPKVWGFTEKSEFWAAFFNIADALQRRTPLQWICCQSEEQMTLIREQAQIYDPFLGIAIPQGVVTCLGVLATCGYETPNGLTVELLPKELIPNPLTVPTLVSAAAFPKDATSMLAKHGFLPPLDSTHWASFKKVLTEANPLLAPSLASLESWPKRQGYLDYILEILAQRGCFDEEEQEAFAVLRALACAEPENQGSSGQLALQTRLRVALKAQLLSPKEWERLWKSIVDAWYGYVMTLTPQEVVRLTDLNLTFDL
jgi:hypothetical protein